MSDFITLDRTSPDFEAYLRGTFSRDKRALPVKSLNVNTEHEKVTFQVLPVSMIQRPSSVIVWLKAVRIRSFLVVLFPLFLVLTKNLRSGAAIDPWTLLAATLGVLFLFAAVNLRNDFVDHMKGFDRIDTALRNRPIQSGWLTADCVRKVSHFLLVLAALSSVPVIFAFPKVLAFVAGVAALGYLTLFRLRKTFKERAGGEFGILILVGPLLMCGYELALTGRVQDETLLLGFVWGFIALFSVHLKNLSLIVTQSQARVANLVTYFGFDNGKKFIYYWWLAAIALYTGYHYLYSGLFWAVALSFVVTLSSWTFAVKLIKLSSPVGSEMEWLQKRGTSLVNIIIVLWVIGSLWKLIA